MTAAGAANDTVLHTDYVWLGRGARVITTDFLRPEGGFAETGVVEMRVHRYPTLTGAPVECVLSEHVPVGDLGARHSARLELDDDYCYAVVARSRGGNVRFERIDVAVSATSPAPGNQTPPSRSSIEPLARPAPR